MTESLSNLSETLCPVQHLLFLRRDWGCLPTILISMRTQLCPTLGSSFIFNYTGTVTPANIIQWPTLGIAERYYVRSKTMDIMIWNKEWNLIWRKQIHTTFSLKIVVVLACPTITTSDRTAAHQCRTSQMMSDIRRNNHKIFHALLHQMFIMYPHIRPTCKKGIL